MTDLLERPEGAMPTQEESELATRASQVLAPKAEEKLKIKLDDGTELTLPKAATRLLHHILTQMSLGHAVTLIPIHAELTTQEAADYLNVSSPFLIKLLETNRIPFHMVGTHRRVKFTELEAFRRRAEQERRVAMQELTDQAQELGMGY